MPRYISFGKYTQAALAGVRKDGYASRTLVLERLVDSLGGELQSVYFPTSGEWDLITIQDLPDSKAAFALWTFAGSIGVVERSQVVELLTADEADTAIGRSGPIIFQAPGRS
jgi:uncharacterized protein with GYD domain